MSNAPAMGYITSREGPRIMGLTDGTSRILYAKLDDGRRVIGRAWAPEQGRLPPPPLNEGDRIVATCFFDTPGQEVWEFRRVQ